MAGPRNPITGRDDIFGGPDPSMGRNYLQHIDLDQLVIGNLTGLEVTVAGRMDDHLDTLAGITCIVSPSVSQGIGGNWAGAGFFKLDMRNVGLAVSGYFCAAEFEVCPNATPVAEGQPMYGIIVLNDINDHANPAAIHPERAYIWTRTYGTQRMLNLFYMPDELANQASADHDTHMVVAAGAAVTHDVAIRCTIGATVCWLMASTTHPS